MSRPEIQGRSGSTSSQADLGTAFAVATSLYGRNELQLSGNVGYNAHAGLPTAGFRTSFSRDGLGPEVAVTVQQIYCRRGGSMASLSGQPDGAPALRTMSVSMHDSIAITDQSAPGLWRLARFGELHESRELAEPVCAS